MITLSLLIVAIMVASFECSLRSTDFQTTDDRCKAQGGFCIKREECPNSISEHLLGLCPYDKSEGIECCHGIVTPQTQCEGLRGKCVPQATNCPDTSNIIEAVNCDADEKCCVLE